MECSVSRCKIQQGAVRCNPTYCYQYPNADETERKEYPSLHQLSETGTDQTQHGGIDVKRLSDGFVCFAMLLVFHRFAHWVVAVLYHNRGHPGIALRSVPGSFCCAIFRLRLCERLRNCCQDTDGVFDHGRTPKAAGNITRSRRWHSHRLCGCKTPLVVYNTDLWSRRVKRLFLAGVAVPGSPLLKSLLLAVWIPNALNTW